DVRINMMSRKLHVLPVLSPVDLNRIPMDFIENFIEGCIFRDLSISVLGEEYNESVVNFISKNDQKRISLDMDDMLIDRESLFTLPPLYALDVLGFLQDVKWKPDEESFLELVRKRYTNLEIPVDISSAESIFTVLKIVSESPNEQNVVIFVERELLESFIVLMGLIRTEEGIVRLPLTEGIAIINYEFTEEVGGGLTGEWEVIYQGRGHLRVREPSNSFTRLWTVTVWRDSADDPISSGFFSRLNAIKIRYEPGALGRMRT
ncbi:hypothetical protein PMAYCL1PPCAC_19450, partial [Pristionchus mayeri]